MKRTKLKKLVNNQTIRAQDDMVRAIYNVKANYVNSTFMSIIDNGDNNIQIRLTFNEDMKLTNGTEYKPVTAVVMSISDMVRLYNLMTNQLQTLRQLKKIP